jgi:hypothetical protein
MTGHFKESRWLVIILVVASLLRLSGLTAFSLSNDELSALARLQFDSFGDLIKNGVYPDYHPAGVQVFMYYWTALFGTGEWIVRLPFALLGIGSVWLLYKLGREWFGPASGLAAAAGLAVLEYPVLYSQIARPYSPGLFFTLLAAYAWTRLLFPGTSQSLHGKYKLNWTACFVFAVSATMYIHYFSFIFSGLLCLAGLFFVDRKTLPYYLAAGAAIVVLYIPHFDIFLHQLSKGGVGGAEGWLGPPDSSTFGKYLDYCFNNSETLMYIFLVMLGGTVMVYKGTFKTGKFHVLSLLFFLLPFAIAYFYSIYKNPVLQFSVLLFSFPYLLLFLFSFIPRDSLGVTFRVIITILLIGGTYSTVVAEQYYKKQHFTEFRGIARRVAELDLKYGKDQIARAVNMHDPYYINYYLDKLKHTTTFGVYRINSPEEIAAFSDFIDQSNTSYFIYAFSNMYDDPKLDMMVRSKFPYVQLRDSMLNSGLRFYSAAPTDSFISELPYLRYSYGFETGEWPGESECVDHELMFEGKRSILLNETREYGPTYALKLLSADITAGSRMEISAAFMPEQVPSAAKLVLSIDRDGKNIAWFGEEVGKFVNRPGKWGRVFLVADMPAELNGTEELKLYCWNEKKEIIRMDDVRFSVYGVRR